MTAVTSRPRRHRPGMRLAVLSGASAPVSAAPIRPAEEGTMTAAAAPVRLPPGPLDEAAAVLGRAVVGDPLFVSVLPDAEQRTSGVSPFTAMSLRIGLVHGEVWVTPPPIRGVASWLAPTHPALTQA